LIKEKKILFFGLGSIGTRHLKLLKKNYNFKIYAYRTSKRKTLPDITNIYNLDEALKIKPDFVFITNPTHLHIETALMCLKAGIKNLFIEKPISNSLDNLDFFLEEVENKKAVVYVAYNLRHNPVLKKLKTLTEERIKDIFYVESICRSYLPKWRPNRDYREIYSSKKEMGGGVILDLSHEFDYNEWLFGKIISINGTYGKISDLDIDSEDICDVIIKFKNRIIGKVHLDYFSRSNERIIKIFTPSEEIITDLLNNNIRIINDKDEYIETFEFEIDSVYEQQLQYYLDGVENNSNEISNLKEAKELLETLLKFKNQNKILTNSNN